MNRISRPILEKIYRRYNRPDLISPDPLQFLSLYTAPGDQEIAGLIAALLAYGRVQQILLSVEKILAPMEGSPADFIISSSTRELTALYKDFKHRFTTGDEIIGLIQGIAFLLKEYKSLEKVFDEGSQGSSLTTHEALIHFTSRLRKTSKLGASHLLPNPEKGSASKRLHLYLRWMVRKDAVDPGCWQSISPSRLIVPLDTHMLNFAQCYGFTERKQGNLKTAMEITEKFRELNPEDPVKYDFSLTRFGIRNDLCWDNLEEEIDS